MALKGAFEINNIEAHHLPKKELIGKNDPYVILEFGSWKHKTETLINAGSHGKWHPKEPIKFECGLAEIETTSLRIVVMEENDVLHDAVIGEASETLSPMLSMPGVKRELELLLVGTDGKKAGKIKVNIVYRKISQVSVTVDKATPISTNPAVTAVHMAKELDRAIKPSAVAKDQAPAAVRSTTSVDSLLNNILLNGGRSKSSSVPKLDSISGFQDDAGLRRMETTKSRGKDDGFFEVRTIEVHDLPKKELFGENDPYVTLEFCKWKLKTETLENAGSHGRWEPNVPIMWDASKDDIERSFLHIVVMEANTLRTDVLIGQASVSLASLSQVPGVRRELDMQLTSEDGHEKAGRLVMDIVYRRRGKAVLTIEEGMRAAQEGVAVEDRGDQITGGDLLLKSIQLDNSPHYQHRKVDWADSADRGEKGIDMTGASDAMADGADGDDGSDDDYNLETLGGNDIDIAVSAWERASKLKASGKGLEGVQDDDHEEDKEIKAYSDPSDTLKGKIRWREGRYKMGKKQFLSNSYIFIPGKMMLAPSFNFGMVFKDFGIVLPSLIFRLSRALKTSTWNVKLPPSRKHLMDSYKILNDTVKKQGGNSNPDKKNPKYADLLIAATAAAAAAAAASEDEYTKNLRGSIDHYHKVLDENARRLFRSINSACIQARTLYRVHEIWSDDCDEDVVAQWVQESNPKGAMPYILGVADKTDFHESVWAQLRDGCIENYALACKEHRVPAEVVIDPLPFYEKHIPVTYHPITGHPTKSIPHPAITHLVISDNRILLEQKITEVVLWGVILVNGGIRESELGILAVQFGLPMIAFKYTGGAADIIIEMVEKVEKWVNQKRAKMLVTGDLPPRPFPDDIQVGYLPPQWLKPFDQNMIVYCTMLNTLIENWPDRYNKDSVFCVDMFETPEDVVQDRLTLTVGSLAGGDSYELGGVASEQRRISYAWRCRHKFHYNAAIFLFISDMLQILGVFFAFMSTMAATLYTYLSFTHATHIMFPKYQHIEHHQLDQILSMLVQLNIVFPLLGTVIRGITAAIGPYSKYVVLTNACVKIEAEVYVFRCKVGQYSAMKEVDEDDDDDEEEDDEGGNDEGNEDAGLPNPRKSFYVNIGRVWSDLSASDLSNGTLRAPPFPGAALDDINARLHSNRKEQLTYLIPIQRRSGSAGGGGGGSDIKKKDVDGEDAEEKKMVSWIDTIKGIFAQGAKVSSSEAEAVTIDDGVSPLSADDYVVLRVIPMAALMTKQAPGYALGRLICIGLGVIFSVMASALTAFELIAFIPTVLALANASNAMSQYWQFELRLMQTNSARSQLHQVLAWWESLTLIEKRVPANKTKLVKTVEATIQAQATVFQTGGGGGDSGGDE